MFANCSQCYPCVRNGQVIYRVCNDPSTPYYRRCVKATICLRCKARTDPKPTPEEPEPRPNKRRRANVAPSPNAPNLLRRAMSYAEAVIEWTAAGRPERSDEEVQQVFKQFCKPCKWFKARHNICRGCGCRVADSGFAIFNKIKMATQHCPRRRW